MATRNGKLANLPNDIREQLNLRLLEGETGRELAAWLNSQPEVQAILGANFNGSPISEVNLTHWRQGGYLQWLTERECFDSARALAEGACNLATTGLSAERLLNVLTVRLGQLLMRWDFSPDDGASEAATFSLVARKARILQGISRSLLAIHRIQSKQSSPASAPIKNEFLSPASKVASTVAPKRPIASQSPVVEIPRSDAPPKSATLSSAPAPTSPHPVPGLAAAGSNRRRASRGRPSDDLETPFDPAAFLSLLSSLSDTPFTPDLHPAEILPAV